MSAILKFYFQKREQLRFSEVNYLNYTQKKQPILHVATKFSLKQWETRTSHGPIPHPLKGNDILLLFAILFLWLNLENHLHSQNALIVSEYKIIIF